MLQNIKLLYGKKIGATDGDIGHVKDFYFDDVTWMVRYLVVDTGAWLAGRQVLLPPHAFGPRPFGKTDTDLKLMQTNLTRRQIEDSPSIETHKPVSRQHEEAYYNYYGWPAYWMEAGMAGGISLPPGIPIGDQVRPSPERDHQRDDPHLRSTKAVDGYAIRAGEETIGFVNGYMVEGLNWRIRELVVETGHWYAGKEIYILPKNITRISYSESTLSVNLSKSDIEHTVRHDVAQASV